MSFRLGVDVSTLTVGFRGSMSFSMDRSYSRYLVKLTEQYYTMMFETPTSLAGFFAAGVTPDELAPFIGPDNPATYVASVTYGRAFYMLVESTAQAYEMEAALNATYDKVVDVNVDAEANYVRELSDVKFHVFVMGGDSPHQVLSLLQGDVSSLEDYIENGGDVTKGVPLSYALRNLKDHSMVGVKVATDYEVRDCWVVTLGDRYSGFTNGSTDGWTTWGGASEVVCKNDPPGDHGFYIQSEDDSDEWGWWFSAPTKFRGDWSALYGGRLSFYIWRILGDAYTPNEPYDVMIYGSENNEILRLAFSDAGLPPPPTAGFIRYSIPLDTSISWYYQRPDGVLGPATEEQIRGVFASVDALRVRGDWKLGLNDWTRIDEVRLERPQ